MLFKFEASRIRGEICFQQHDTWSRSIWFFRQYNYFELQVPHTRIFYLISYRKRLGARKIDKLPHTNNISEWKNDAPRAKTVPVSSLWKPYIVSGHMNSYRGGIFYVSQMETTKNAPARSIFYHKWAYNRRFAFKLCGRWILFKRDVSPIFFSTFLHKWLSFPF